MDKIIFLMLPQIRAANFISKGSRFYRDWQQFLSKWAANIFNEIIFYIK
jgi:fibrillarin-like rRNA methylase